MRLKNKVILVTASTRGIGLAIVKSCAKEGAVVYMAARNLEAAAKTADELNAQGHRIKCVYNDARQPDTFSSMVDEVIEKEGHLDVLVNNFGTSDPKKRFGSQRESARPPVPPPYRRPPRPRYCR